MLFAIQMSLKFPRRYNVHSGQLLCQRVTLGDPGSHVLYLGFVNCPWTV